jgi:Holliday junction resolvasome RuvABC endonuclease subunit
MLVPRLPRSATGNVISCDLASTTGYCIGPFGGRPRFGGVALRGDDAIQRMAALREFLYQEHEFSRISAVVLEAAIIGDHRSSLAAEILTSLQAMAGLWALDEDVPIIRVASSTARKAMIGTGRFPKGEAKQHVTAWCRERGFEVKSHDAADAVLLWKAVEQSTIGASAPREVSA